MAKPDRLKQRLADAMERADKLGVELQQVRDAARQLMAGLTEYSKENNWDYNGEIEQHVWVGEGKGPTIARKFLGLEEERN